MTEVVKSEGLENILACFDDVIIEGNSLDKLQKHSKMFLKLVGDRKVTSNKTRMNSKMESFVYEAKHLPDNGSKVGGVCVRLRKVENQKCQFTSWKM